ncbi:MAG TPA: hypothetical protein VHC69_19895 [Polyangiaceae bacterium]|nr:hypothetical protein [Polyangiaceae bacterium]
MVTAKVRFFKATTAMVAYMLGARLVAAAPADQPEPTETAAPAQPPAPAVPTNVPPVTPAPSVAPPGPAGDGARAPAVHHAAVAVAPPHAPLLLRALIESPHLVRRAILVYRVAQSSVEPRSSAWRELDFMRSAVGPYVAMVPKDDVRPPGLDYLVELELLDGRRVPAFASRLVPQHVSVYEDPMDVRERLALERLHGRRSAVGASFDYVRFTNLGGPDADWYYRAEGSYTYRVLRTVDEFAIHVGAVRGRSPGNDDLVGLNYAAASLKLRVVDVFRIEGTLLSSVTESGFAGGGGGAMDIGDPFGAKLRLGFEAVHRFGARWYSQVDVPVVAGLRLSPIVEATSMPHAGRYGVRLQGELAYDFGNGFAASIRGGYQARVATDGAPGGGASVTYAF